MKKKFTLTSTVEAFQWDGSREAFEHIKKMFSEQGAEVFMIEEIDNILLVRKYKGSDLATQYDVYTVGTYLTKDNGYDFVTTFYPGDWTEVTGQESLQEKKKKKWSIWE